MSSFLQFSGKLQGWTDGMDLDPALTLLIGVMTFIRGLHEAFIDYQQVMASLIVYGIKTIIQIVYIMGMWSVLADRKFLKCTVQCRIKKYAMTEENAWLKLMLYGPINNSAVIQTYKRCCCIGVLRPRVGNSI